MAFDNIFLLSWVRFNCHGRNSTVNFLAGVGRRRRRNSVEGDSFVSQSVPQVILCARSGTASATARAEHVPLGNPQRDIAVSG